MGPTDGWAWSRGSRRAPPARRPTPFTSSPGSSSFASFPLRRPRSCASTPTCAGSTSSRWFAARGTRIRADAPPVPRVGRKRRSTFAEVVRLAHASAGNSINSARERHGRDSDNRPDEGLRQGHRLFDLDLEVAARRGLRLPRPERRRQVDDDAAAARPDPADRGVGDAARARQPRRQPRGPPPRRLPARRPRALSEADRRRRCSTTSPRCAAASTGASATSWPSASTRSSTARCASSRRATARSSA